MKYLYYLFYTCGISESYIVPIFILYQLFIFFILFLFETQYIIWPGLCSQTFLMFACRSLCDREVLRIDFEEKCWEGRHATFILLLGIPGFLLYVLGCPMVVLIITKRLHARAKLQNKNVSSMKSFHTWGRFFSMFRPHLWWWEGTVALRKIALVALGVFGSSLGAMQIHVTGFIFFLNLMATAKVQPYADKTGILMSIEMACLSCVWCTLWAASVFNDHPRCEDGQGGYILWCNLVSGLIGAADVLVAASIPGVFVYLKWKRKKEKHRLKKAERERSMSVQQREAEEHERKLSALDQIVDPEERGRQYMEVTQERESKIRERMTASDMMVNPSIEMAVLDASRRGRGGGGGGGESPGGAHESSSSSSLSNLSEEIVLTVAIQKKTSLSSNVSQKN